MDGSIIFDLLVLIVGWKPGVGERMPSGAENVPLSVLDGPAIPRIVDLPKGGGDFR